MLFTLDTPARDLIGSMIELGACGSAMDYLAAMPDWTLREYIAISEMDPNAPSQSWFLWAFQTCRHLFDREARLAFLKTITDHGGALGLFVDIEDLYPEEEAELERTFRDKFPDVAQRLDVGELQTKRKGVKLDA